MISTRRVVTSSLIAGLVGSPCLALAENTFQAEAGLSYSRFKSDSLRQNTAGAEASYFFDKLPTQPKDYPLEQAQFVERIGSITANYSQSSLNMPNFDVSTSSSAYGATVLLARPDTPFFASAGFASSSGETRGSPGESEIDSRTYVLSAGAYVDKTTALSLALFKNKARIEGTSFGSPFVTRNTFTSIEFLGQHLAQLSGGDHVALAAGLALDKNEPESAASQKNHSIFLQGTYYPVKTLGLKLGVQFNRGDNSRAEGESYLAGVKMFVTPRISLSVDYLRFLAELPNNNDSVVLLKGLVRF